MSRICVVIPAYNVAQTLGSLVVQLRAMGYDAVVVDDGSADRTAEVARASGAAVLSHETNYGKGRSLRDGFRWGLGQGYEIFVAMDGDGQHRPSDLPRLLEALTRDTVGLVVGDRTGDLRAMPWIRRVTNTILSRWVSRWCGQPVADTQCGFRAIRRAVLERITLTTDRYEIESELLVRASRAGFRIASVPVATVYERERSRIHPVADTLRFFKFLRTLDQDVTSYK